MNILNAEVRREGDYDDFGDWQEAYYVDLKVHTVVVASILVDDAYSGDTDLEIIAQGLSQFFSNVSTVR